MLFQELWNLAQGSSSSTSIYVKTVPAFSSLFILKWCFYFNNKDIIHTGFRGKSRWWTDDNWWLLSLSARFQRSSLQQFLDGEASDQCWYYTNESFTETTIERSSEKIGSCWVSHGGISLWNSERICTTGDRLTVTFQEGILFSKTI